MKDRITVQEAARRLGIKDDAIRKRIQRGSLEHDKDPDGRVFVYLEAAHVAYSDGYKDSACYPSENGTNSAAQDTAQDSAKGSSYSELVEVLRSELEAWKQVIATRDEELKRKDHVIAALTKRIPEIEAPPEALRKPQDYPITASKDFGQGNDGRVEREKLTTYPWWRRLFSIS